MSQPAKVVKKRAEPGAGGKRGHSAGSRGGPGADDDDPLTEVRGWGMHQGLGAGLGACIRF